MGDVIGFVRRDEHEADRFKRLSQYGSVPVDDDAKMIDEVVALGSPEDWAWSAILYLKSSLHGTLGGTSGGSVTVSAAAVGLVIGYVESLALETGLIK